jgi:SlyX protein
MASGPAGAIAIEERLAHLMRAVDDLSDIVARQQREIAALTRRVAFLAAREAERAEAPANAPPADTPPPHW